MTTYYNTEQELYAETQKTIKELAPASVSHNYHVTNSGGWYVNKNNRQALTIASTMYILYDIAGAITHVIMEKIVNNREYSITLINHQE